MNFNIYLIYYFTIYDLLFIYDLTIYDLLFIYYLTIYCNLFKFRLLTKTLKTPLPMSWLFEFLC